MNSTPHTPARIAAARFLNHLAETPRGTRREPGRGLRTNWSGIETNEAWKAPAFHVGSTRKAPAAAATLAPRKELQATLAQGEDKTIFVPTGKFKTLKNGETREIKARVFIWSRSVTIGTTHYRFGSAAKVVTLTSTAAPGREGDYSKLNDAEVKPVSLRRTPEQVTEIFRRILPAQASTLIHHLFNL